MKLKLGQLTVLFAFVVTIMMLVPQDKGFSGDLSDHMPDLWINGDPANSNDVDYGRLRTPDNPGIQLIGGVEDPRGKSFNEMCGTNGDESVSGFAWYYGGGMMDDPSAHAADPDGPNHDTAFVQNVYTLYLNGSASTSASEASGSLDPGIRDAEAIELPAAHNTRSFKGQGKITLDIPSLDYHEPRYDHNNYYRGCTTKTSKTYYFKPTHESVLKVLVNIENVKEKRTGSINVSGDFKGASSSFTHEWEWEKSWNKQKGRGFGMRASVGGWWEAFNYPVLKLQGKTAKVDGWVQSAGLPTLQAEFDTRNSPCPPNSSGYSSTPSDYVPHVR